MILVYPEIEKNMTKAYASKYDKTISKYKEVMKKFSEKEQNKEWIYIVKQLWES